MCLPTVTAMCPHTLLVKYCALTTHLVSEHAEAAPIFWFLVLPFQLLSRD